VTEELAGVAKESPELGKMTQPTSESSNPPHHGIELDEETPGWCPFALEVHGLAGKARRNLVDAKVRRGFLGARVIETEGGWRRWKEDAKEIAGNYLLAEIESNFIFLFF
jgi:hypothetical protein